MTALLALDTSGPYCAASLMLGGQVVASVRDDMQRGQAEHVMPMLENLLHAEGVVWAELDAIGVGIGPGNFTGIRISVAAARGLALGLGVPAIGVSLFEAAFDHVKPTAPAAVAVAGPRQTHYVQRFDGGQPAGAATIVPPLDGPRGWGVERLIHVGDPACGAALAADLGDPPVSINAPEVDYLGDFVSLTDHIAHVAARKLERGALERPSPMYVRAPDAAPSRTPAPVLLS